MGGWDPGALADAAGVKRTSGDTEHTKLTKKSAEEGGSFLLVCLVNLLDNIGSGIGLRPLQIGQELTPVPLLRCEV